MRLFYKVITILLFCVTTVQVGAQQYKTVLPYRMVGGKMIVDMIMNGTPRSFIFDTGGRTALTGEICEELGLEVVDSLVVTDVNSNEAVYPLVLIESLLTPDEKINFRNVPAMKLSKPSPFECFHTDGLIGSDLFVRTIVEIDGKAKTVTIISAENPSTASLRKMLPFVRAGMPIISLQAGVGNAITCLFDTGNPTFLSLKDTDFEALRSAAALEVLSEGYGEGSIGVTGMADADVSYRVRFPLLSVGSTKFKNVDSETSISPYTLLGVSLLDYGKVTLDYPRARFYFEAYEQENDLECKHYNVGLRVKDGELVVATVWRAMKGQVEVGDKVIKINGKPVGRYDFCESIINGIPELKVKKKTKLTIQTRQGEKVIIYQKE
ncbi:hypothetical protein [Butyricimonas paravirosa]|uniref:hypothetical protein n=1 Tax=Butyricimonas paravirosa TaxID=1472417 RepID=UPI0021096429|nr:hypothetical protein [Butyricimonas paravirosa]MCQ4873609.1 hypothetical protein [Butyricimonas paravirosa]